MKKIIIGFISLFFIFSSCEFQVPQKVSVKTNAEYNFTVADIEKDFSQYFDLATTLKESLGDDSPIKIYDYNPGENPNAAQQFLVEFSMVDVDMDFSSYLKDLDLENSFEDMSFETSIEMPDIGSVDISQEITKLDDIEKAVNALVTIGGTSGGKITFASAGESEIKGEFSEVEYEEGLLTITAYGANLKTVKMKKDGAVISSNSFSQIETGTYKAVLSFTNKSLYKEGMSIEFEGGTVARYLGTMSGKIKTAKGVSLKDNFDNPKTFSFTINQTIPTQTSEDTFETCTIDEGSIELQVETPTEWSGVTINSDFTLSGALDVSVSGSGAERKKSLRNINLGHGNTDAVGTLEIELNNATIDFSKKPKFIGSLKIDEMSVAKKIEGLQTSIEKEIDFGEAANYIKRIVFDAGNGISGTYTNTFPAGNNITLELSSEFMGLEDKSAQIEGGRTNGTFEIKSNAEHTANIAADKKIDFKAGLRLPGYTPENPTLVKLTKIKPNKKYDLSFSVKPELKWKSVTINLPDEKSIDGNVDTKISLDSIFDSLTDKLGEDGSNFVKNIGFRDMNLYMFCAKPGISLFDEISIQGKMKLQFEKESAVEKEIYILGTDGAEEQLKFIDFAGITIADEEKNLVTKSMTTYEQSLPKTPDLGEIFSAKNEGTMKIDYKLKLAGAGEEGDITLTCDELEDLQNNGKASLKMVAYITLPLKFKCYEQGTLDLLKLIDKDGSDGEDLFGRTEPPEENKLIKSLDAIKEIAIIYKGYSVPFRYDQSSKSAGLAIDLKVAESTPKNLYLNGGTFAISGAEIVGVMSELFNPSIKIVMPKGNFEISRNLNIGANIVLRIKTDGTIDLFGDD